MGPVEMLTSELFLLGHRSRRDSFDSRPNPFMVGSIRVRAESSARDALQVKLHFSFYRIGTEAGKCEIVVVNVNHGNSLRIATLYREQRNL